MTIYSVNIDALKQVLFNMKLANQSLRAEYNQCLAQSLVRRDSRHRDAHNQLKLLVPLARALNIYLQNQHNRYRAYEAYIKQYKRLVSAITEAVAYTDITTVAKRYARILSIFVPYPASDKASVLQVGCSIDQLITGLKQTEIEIRQTQKAAHRELMSSLSTQQQALLRKLANPKTGAVTLNIKLLDTD